ncbi:MAG: hypothetical protein WCX61_02575, partial [Candidatus Peribacteraceae bacterium]
ANGPECDNGIDDDGDTLADYPLDPGCTGPTDNDERDRPDLSIIKSGVVSINRGKTIVYTLSIENNGPGNARNITVTDDIPAGLTFNRTYSDLDCIKENVANRVLCNNTELTDGAQRTYLVAFDIPATYPCGDTIVNESHVSTSSSDPNDQNNHSTVVTTVACTQCSDGIDNDQDNATDLSDFSCTSIDDDDETNPKAQCQDGVDNDGDQLVDYPTDPGCSSLQDNDEANPTTGTDISIDKTGPLTILRGSTILYTLTVTNNGPNVAQNLIASDKTPAGLTYNAGQSSADCIEEGDSILCNNIELGVGATKQYSVAFNVTNAVQCGSTITNEAAVSISNGDPFNTQNNQDVTHTTVQCQNPTFTISKTDNRTTVQLGEILTYEITVTNTSAVDATNVTVTDTLPVHTTYLSSTNGGQHNGGAVTWSGLSVSAGQTITLQVQVTVSQSAPVQFQLTNTAFVGGAQASDTTVVEAPAQLQADVRISKTGPQSVERGNTVSYTLSVTNDGPDAAKNVIVSDVIPAGLTFNASASDTGCIQQGTSVLCNNIASLASGAHQDYHVVFTVSAAAQCDSVITNTGAVSISNTDPNESNNVSQAVQTTVTCPGQPTFTISKTDSRTTVQPGETLTYVITVTNTSAINATNVVVTDSLPVHTTYLSSTNGGQHNGGVMVWTIPSIPAQQQVQLSVTVQVSTTAPNGWQLTNTAFVDGIPGQDTTVVQSGGTQHDIGIVKTGPTTVQVGQTVIYTLTATNNGPDTATNVIVSDPVPAGLSFNASQSSTDCILQGTDVLCNNITLTNGQSRSYSVAFNVPGTVTCPGTITNTATVSVSSGDTNPSNNSSTATTSVQCATGHLTISKTDNHDTALPGEALVYTITLTNVSSSPVTNVLVEDTLPSNLTYISASNGGVVVQSNPTIVRWQSLTLAAGEVKELFLYAQVNQSTPNGTVLVNTVSATASPTVTAQDTTTVQTGATGKSADLRITKSGPGTVQSGSTLSYTISVTNDGPDSATGVTITDVIPTGLSFVSADADCALQSTNVVCTHSGPLTSGSTDTFQITLKPQQTLACNSSITNTSSVTAGTPDPDAIDNTSNSVQTTLLCNGPTDQPTFSISKTDGRTTVQPGETLTYTITVTNTSAVNATNARVNDILPSQLTYLSSSDSGQHSSGMVTWTGLSIAAGASKTLTVQTQVQSTVPDGTIIRNVAAVGINLAQDDTTVQGSTQTNVTIDLTDSIDPVEPCQSYNYNVRVTNLNASPVSGLLVKLMMDQDTTFLTADNGGSHSNDIVTWSNVSIAANGYTTLTATVKADCTTETDDILRAWASTNNAMDEETTRVDDGGTNGQDVTISITDSPDPVEIGEVLSYSIRVCNEESTQRDIDVTAFLDEDTSFLDASDSGDDTSNDEVEWNNISIDGDDCETLILRVRILNSAVEGSTVRLRARAEDEEDTENTRIVEYGAPIPPIPTPGEPATVSVDKSADRDEVQPGSIATYTVTIQNTSPYSIENMQVEDTFTAGSLTVEDAASGNVVGNTIRWNVPILGANATRVLRYRVRVDSTMRHGQVITNSVTVSSPDLSGTPSDTEQIRVIEQLPQTGLGGFLASLDNTDLAIRPHARQSITAPGAAAANTSLPFIIWTNIIAIGISGGWLFGRKLFF